MDVVMPAERELAPYVPPLAVEWLAEGRGEKHRAIDCTLVFNDISGFTRMTELLGAQGRIGAEEMAAIINGVFEPLFAAAYARGGQLIKWGGDATLMMFHGPDHVRRACRAAWDMQRARREAGSVVTARGRVRLRMSIGVHSGTHDWFFLGGDEHRELVVCGAGVTTLTQMEKLAGPGQILLSDEAAAALVNAGEPAPGALPGGGNLLRRAPAAGEPVTPIDTHAPVDPLTPAEPPASTARPTATGEPAGVDISAAMCSALREHILGGGLESGHRHVAVGFAKISGVDRLLREQGPAVAAEEIERGLQVIQRAAVSYDVAFLATDLGPDSVKVMLSAGAPHHAGQDERRLIAALLEAVDSDGVLPVRAGVTSGRVFAGDFGPSYRRTYSVMGDCVNLAARLMEHAGERELLATEQLATSAVAGSANPHGTTLSVKGKRAPVAVWRITAEDTRAQAEEEPDSEPLIGREDELASLVEAARSVAAGAGRVITLVGEPGMGKSKLLAELQRLTPADVLYTSGDVYARSRPYDPFQRLVRARWGLSADASAAEVAERLTEVTRERAPHLIPWLSLIGIVAGVDLPASREVEQTDAALRKQRLDEVTSGLLGATLTEPTTLIFDDVHLMDDASRELISQLAGDAAGRPWLLIVSQRAGQTIRLGGASGELMTLGPLSDAGASRLLAHATAASPLPPHRLAELARRSAGNPLFMRALVAQLADGGDPSALPASVEEAIAARIDRLATGDRRTLRAAAVLGIEVEIELLAEVMGDEWPGSRSHALGALNEFLEPVGDRQWHFRHQLMREVAYEGLPYKRRTDLHRRTADAIEREAGGFDEQHAELLSLHCFHGGRFADAWTYLLKAAQSAHSRYANAEAAESYRLALRAAAHVPDLDPAELAGVDAALADICIELGELAGADVALRRALRRVKGSPAEMARLQMRLARLRDLSGQHRAALAWADRADATLAGLDGSEAELLRGQLAVRRVRNAYQRGRHREALALSEHAIELARGSGDERILAEALEYADLCACELGVPAHERAEEALGVYEGLGDLAAQARVNNTLGLLAYHRGAWSAAIDHYTAAERAYVKAGRIWDSATPAANRAEILIDQGRLDEARQDLEQVILVWRGVDAASEIAFGEYQLGRIAARRGEAGEAMTLLESARTHFRAAGELNEVVVVDAAVAECLLLSGDHAAALAAAEKTLARARALGGSSSATPLLHRVRGVALLALGRRPEAGRALRAALKAARERSALHEIAFTLKDLIDGEIAAGTAEEHAWQEELGSLSTELGIEPAAHPDHARRTSARADDPPAGVQTALA